MLVALATGGPIRVIEVIVVFEIIQLVEGNTLVPLVMSRAAKLNPLVVIVAVITGASALGVGGAALAVPVAVVVQSLVMRLLVPLAQRASGTEIIESVTVETTKVIARRPTAPREPSASPASPASPPAGQPDAPASAPAITPQTTAPAGVEQPV